MPISAQEWHPIAVHFPLALVLTGAFALSASCIGGLKHHRAVLATVATWNICLGALGALFALGTGLVAVMGLHLAPEARAAVGLHVRWAVFTSMALLLLAVWRGAGGAPDAKPSRWFLGVLWAVSAALIFTGYRGGENVYRYGVGLTSEAHAAGAGARDAKE